MDIAGQRGFWKFWKDVRAGQSVFESGTGFSGWFRRIVGGSLAASGGRLRIVGECPRYLSLIGLGSVAVGPMKTSEGSTEKLGN